MPLFDDDLLPEPSPDPTPGQETEEEDAGSEPEDGTEEPADEELPAKFKGDREKFDRSYSQMEAAFTRSQQENKALREQMAYLAGAIQGQMPAQSPRHDEEPDAEAWMEQLYKGPQVIDQRLEQKLEQKLAQYLGPLSQVMTQSIYDRQALALAARYPDCGNYLQEMQQVYQEFPEFMTRPDGMERAYRLAKANKLLSVQADDTTALAKQAARMPGQAARGKTQGKTDPEDALKADIFGGGGAKGIFG